MPIHDWTRVDAGLFHAFRQGWISALCDALNSRTLPVDWFAIAERTSPVSIPDALELQLATGCDHSEEDDLTFPTNGGRAGVVI